MGAVSQFFNATFSSMKHAWKTARPVVKIASAVAAVAGAALLVSAPALTIPAGVLMAVGGAGIAKDIYEVMEGAYEATKKAISHTCDEVVEAKGKFVHAWEHAKPWMKIVTGAAGVTVVGLAVFVPQLAVPVGALATVAVAGALKDVAEAAEEVADVAGGIAKESTINPERLRTIEHEVDMAAIEKVVAKNPDIVHAFEDVVHTPVEGVDVSTNGPISAAETVHNEPHGDHVH